MKTLIVAAKETCGGVFWVIDDELFAFPFNGKYLDGVAKSGNTYNHKKLWPQVKPKGCNKSYNYFPRGRVHITNKGISQIYMNPTIDESIIPWIKQEFGLRDNPIINYDYSEHYMCYLEDDWKADK